MNATENGTTSLEGLARRLEALECENAELRGKVAALEESHGRRDEASGPGGSKPLGELEGGRISRRRLLGKAGAAAAGLVVAGALTQRDIREARADAPKTFTSTSASIPGVTGENTFGGIGVFGTGLYGVQGESSGATGQGVHGTIRPRVTEFWGILKAESQSVAGPSAPPVRGFMVSTSVAATEGSLMGGHAFFDTRCVTSTVAEKKPGALTGLPLVLTCRTLVSCRTWIRTRTK